MRRYWKWIVMAALAVALCLSLKHSRDMRLRWVRERDNVDALTADYELSETRRGEAVATIQELQYTVDEFKRRQSEDAATIRQLKIRASEVREVVKTVVETKIAYRDTIIFIKPDSVLHWSRDTKWWSVNQTIDLAQNPPITEFNLHTRDSLTHYLYRVPKCRFLGIHWGTKGYEVKIVNHNPNSTITYARWINVSEVKWKRDRE